MLHEPLSVDGPLISNALNITKYFKPYSWALTAA